MRDRIVMPILCRGRGVWWSACNRLVFAVRAGGLRERRTNANACAQHERHDNQHELSDPFHGSLLQEVKGEAAMPRSLVAHALDQAPVSAILRAEGNS